MVRLTIVAFVLLVGAFGTRRLWFGPINGDFNMVTRSYPHSVSITLMNQVIGMSSPLPVVSEDLVNQWKLHASQNVEGKPPNGNHSYSNSFQYQNKAYSLSRSSQENNVGPMFLMHKDGQSGSYQNVSKSLAKGVQFASVYCKGDTLYVFYTLIGDHPGRILLGTIDLKKSSWNLLPGPEIMKPPGMTSRPTFSDREKIQEIRDPLFVPNDNEGQDELSGTLFLTLQGKVESIEAANLRMNLTLYQDSVKFRDPALIDDLVFQSSSLANQTSTKYRRKVLITGVGRSGTTFVCKFLNQVGWNISHDNSKDCGPFGGADGASSWYNAFRRPPTKPYRALMVEKVIHLTRSPLPVVKSRMARIVSKGPSNWDTIKQIIWDWENPITYNNGTEIDSSSSSTALPSLILRHWINRNSFLSQHAAWRVSIEDLTADPLTAYHLCLEAELDRDDGEACATLPLIRSVLSSMGSGINNNGRVEGFDEADLSWWNRMAELNKDDVRIALKIAEEYGYSIEKNIMAAFDVAKVKYSCKFQNEEDARLEKQDPLHWGCSLI